MQNKLECPYCGSTDFERVDASATEKMAGDKEPVYRCKACGRTYTESTPNQMGGDNDPWG